MTKKNSNNDWLIFRAKLIETARQMGRARTACDCWTRGRKPVSYLSSGLHSDPELLLCLHFCSFGLLWISACLLSLLLSLYLLQPCPSDSFVFQIFFNEVVTEACTFLLIMFPEEDTTKPRVFASACAVTRSGGYCCIKNNNNFCRR